MTEEITKPQNKPQKSEASYKLVDKDSLKTVDDPCVVKYSYSVDGKKLNSEQQFQSKTACIDFPLEEGQKIQVQYEINNMEESNIQTNGKASESSPWSALLTSLTFVVGAIIMLKPKKTA